MQALNLIVRTQKIQFSRLGRTYWYTSMLQFEIIIIIPQMFFAIHNTYCQRLTNSRLLLRREHAESIAPSLVGKNTQACTYGRIVDCRSLRFSWAENERQLAHGKGCSLKWEKPTLNTVCSRGRLYASAIHEQYFCQPAEAWLGMIRTSAAGMNWL